METLPLRIPPGADLRRTLEAVEGDARFVIAGIGSLSEVALRFAGAPSALPRSGAFEILTLSGSLSADGAHLHASVADADGRVAGGHVAYGCIVRTTAEVLLVPLPGWALTRERDAATGYPELVVRPVASGSAR
jgi:uncharacterized protein